MSLAATAIAYEARTGDPLAKLVLIALADFSDEVGRSCVGVLELAEFAQCEGSAVIAALGALERAGLITYDMGLGAATIHGVTP